MDPIDVLAVYRLWRLAAKDTIADRPRDAFKAWAWDRHHRLVDPAASPGQDPPPKLIELLQCPWCLGLWLVLLALAVRQASPRAWQLARIPLALSAGVGIVAETVDRLER